MWKVKSIANCGFLIACSFVYFRMVEMLVPPLRGFYAILGTFSHRFRAGLRCFVPTGLFACKASPKLALWVVAFSHDINT